MMISFRGKLEEYREFEPGRWRREDANGDWIVEDGVTTVADGVTFAEVYARRQRVSASSLDPRDEKIALLEARLEKLEATEKSRVSRSA